MNGIDSAHRGPSSAGGRYRIGPIALEILALAGLFLTGCTTVEENPRSVPLIHTAAKPLSKTITGTEFTIDPSGERVQDIEELILRYYALHDHHLPEKLEDVRATADVNINVNFTSPANGQPYVYLSPGAPDITLSHRLILYDPLADKNGMRWVIIMDEPRGNYLPMQARQISESQFHAYAQGK